MTRQSQYLATTAASLGLISAFALVGCKTNDAETESSAKPSATPSAFASQVAMGAEVYTASCAKCHGNAGQGTEKAPAVVGEGALARFGTAMDVAAFVTENMPGDNPGSLTGEQYWAVLAFALSANGIERTKAVGPSNAESIALNP